MTVSTLTSRVVYRGNGSATSFPVPFKVLDEDHLVVTRQVFATGALDYTYVGTDYSYTGIGDDSGTLTLSGTALSSTYELVIERVVPYTQELDLVNSGGFYPETVEEQLDLTVMGLQQVASTADQALDTAETLVEDAEAAAQAVLDSAVFTVTSAAGQSVTTRTLLAGITTPANGQTAYLAEAGRQGWFKFSTANLSAQVTADPLQGIYVAPSSDTDGSSGAWVRELDGPLYPAQFGAAGDGVADDTAEFQAALTHAPLANGVVDGQGKTYLISSELSAPDGVDPVNARFELPNQVTTTLTANVTSGTGAKSLSVASSANFLNKSVMLATAPATVSHTDTFSHQNRIVTTADSGTTMTLDAGAAIAAHSTGATVATTTHILRLLGNNTVRDCIFDGNEANQTYAHWVTSTLLVVEGDKCTIENCEFVDTPSDAILIGGPSGGEIIISKVLGCVFENIGGNGIHCGNNADVFVDGCWAKDGNMRWTDPVVEGGGNSVRDGHQDGFITFSNDVRRLKASDNYVENFGGGIVSVGTEGAVYGESVHSSNNTFINCFSPYEMTGPSKEFAIDNDRCIATYPFPRWSTQKLLFNGTSTALPATKITIDGLTVENGFVDMLYVQDVELDISVDNSGSIDEWVGGGVILNTFRGIRGTVRVRGGKVGLFLQTNTAGHSTGSELKVQLLDQKIRAQSGALVGAGTLPMILTGTARGTSGISNADWVGMTHFTGLKMLGVAVDHNLGGGATAFSGGVANTDRKNCIVNGTFE